MFELFKRALSIIYTYKCGNGSCGYVEMSTRTGYMKCPKCKYSMFIFSQTK